MAKRRKIKIRLNLKAIGIGALALLLAGGLIYGQKAIQQKTQVEEQAKGLFGPRCQDRDTKDECTNGGCMDNKTNCRWDKKVEECKKKADKSCGGGGGNPSPSPNPSGGSLPNCSSYLFISGHLFPEICSNFSLLGESKCKDPHDDEYEYYCCPDGKQIKNGKCAPIPTCRTGLYCAGTYDLLRGSSLCLQDQKNPKSFVRCCTKGYVIENNKCVRH